MFFNVSSNLANMCSALTKTNLFMVPLLLPYCVFFNSCTIFKELTNQIESKSKYNKLNHV